MLLTLMKLGELIYPSGISLNQLGSTFVFSDLNRSPNPKGARVRSQPDTTGVRRLLCLDVTLERFHYNSSCQLVEARYFAYPADDECVPFV